MTDKPIAAKDFLGSAHVFATAVRDIMEEKLLQNVAGKQASLPQLQLLTLVARTDRHTIGDVAAFLGVSKAAAGQTVEKLVLENPIGLEDYRKLVPYVSLQQQYAVELSQTYEKMRDYQKSYYPGAWKAEYEVYVQDQASVLATGEYPRAAWSSAPYLEKQNETGETGGTGLIVPFLNISAAKKVTSASLFALNPHLCWKFLNCNFEFQLFGFSQSDKMLIR